MSKLSDFIGGGGSGELLPFNDIGTVTGTVDLDVSQYSSFRVVQGLGDITLNVIGESPNDIYKSELFFYPNYEFSVTYLNTSEVNVSEKNGYICDFIYDSTMDHEGIGLSSTLYDMMFLDGGYTLILVSSGEFHKYSVNVPYTFKGISSVETSSTVPSMSGLPTSFGMSSDGTKVLICSSENFINQYTLTTPYDFSTLTYDDVSLNLTLYEDYSSAVCDFSSDGLKIYASNLSSNSIYQYEMNSPFDLSSAEYVGRTNTASFTTVRYTSVSKDGTKMYQANRNSGNITEGDMSTPWDITSKEYKNVLYLTTRSYGGIDLRWCKLSNNEDYIYLIENGTGGITECHKIVKSSGLYEITYIDSIYGDNILNKARTDILIKE